MKNQPRFRTILLAALVSVVGTFVIGCKPVGGGTSPSSTTSTPATTSPTALRP